MSSQAFRGPEETSVNPELQVLMHAVSSCAGVAVQQLLKQNPALVKEKGWHGQTALHRACLSGDGAMVRLLLEYGADPNATNDFLETPVHYASKRGIPTLVHILAQAGGRLDVKDKSGKTAVHNAAQTGSVYMLQYLEEKGFGFRDVDNSLQSPLHCVCSFGHLEAFKYLLRKGRSDPRQGDSKGDTPLHICVREGYAHGSWLLINYLGLECLHVKNNLGQTPLDIIKQFDTSKKTGHSQLLPLLTELSKMSQNSKVQGPNQLWYFHLLMPTVVYAFAVLLALNVFPNYQGIIFVLALAYIIKSAMKASHRLNHVSRWANPLFAGTFCAGMLHTMLVYYWNIPNYLPHQILLYISIICNIFQLYLYYKLITVDPGVVKTGELNEKTRQPVTLSDLCDKNSTMELFCHECEIVRSKVTKHCKLCDLCYYRMDHHCLFLLKCVAYNNHARFVWFLIETAFVMSMFVFQAYLYVKSKYPEKPYKTMIPDMFWDDCWILSMVFLNVGSIIWAISLIKYQLDVVARGHTTYFQQKISTLTAVDKLFNVLYFLRGRAVYITDFEFDEKEKQYPTQKGYPVQPAYPVQNV
ncbi:uncharacterized protein LOC123563484 [Mercenaria mercenaria]|uniref:uncharacterized protein LOC123563484 n=1 Tax=Mercenaria mercenaria TaxID=6596 RepID=UPI00234EFAB0|nr:uncharacterized protein LOC123563484 [Mercenaria mercenaria]